MGFEYGIVLKNKRYDDAVEILYQEFSIYSDKYRIDKSQTGFSLNLEGEKWPEHMRFYIDTATDVIDFIAVGDEYIYCILHGGIKLNTFIGHIKNAFEKANLHYCLEEL